MEAENEEVFDGGLTALVFGLGFLAGVGYVSQDLTIPRPCEAFFRRMCVNLVDYSWPSVYSCRMSFEFNKEILSVSKGSRPKFIEVYFK